MNRSSLNTVNAGGIRKFFSLALSAAITSLVLLASCGDTVYESKGGGGVAGKDITGTINVHVRDGAGDKPFTSADDGVTVTLIAQGTRPQNLGANGAVSFTNLQPGSYEIRVQKEGYATSYYTARVLLDETEINAGFNVNIPAVIYKLNAELTGTVVYRKANGTSGPAAGAIVTLEVDLNRTRLDKDDYDVKIEERVHVAVVDENGKYTFKNVPTVPGANYKVVSSGFTADGVDFELEDIFGFGAGPNLLAETPVTARTVTVSKVVTQLRVIGYSVSVSGKNKLEFTFNAEPEDLGHSVGLVTIDEVPNADFNVSYKASVLEITPKFAWSKYNSGTLTVTLTGLVSKLGASLAAESREPFEVVVSDHTPFTITNLSSDGSIWLTDSAEAIVLVFSKEIDKTKLTATSYLDIAHKVEIDGATLTLTPAVGNWEKIETANILGLTSLYALDGTRFGGTPPSLKWGVELVEPFALLKSGVVLGNLDSKKAVDLEFTADIKTDDPEAKPGAKIVRNVTSDATFAATTPAAHFASVNEVPIFSVTGNKISVTPGYDWTTGTNNFNMVVVENIGPASGDQPPAYFVFKVVRAPAGAFEIIETAEITEFTTPSSDLEINFSAPLDETQWIKNNISVLPNQPYDFSFKNNGTTLVLKPYATYGWSQATPGTFGNSASDPFYAASLKISFGTDFLALNGDKLAGTPIKYFKQTGSQSGELTALDGVDWFTYDTLSTRSSDIVINTDFEIPLAWLHKEFSAAQGYRLWFYDKLNGVASEPIDLTYSTNFSYYPAGRTVLTAQTDGNHVEGDTIVYKLNVRPTGFSGAWTLVSGRYEIYLAPYNATSIGGYKTAVVVPSFTFANKASKGNQTSGSTPATGASPLWTAEATGASSFAYTVPLTTLSGWSTAAGTGTIDVMKSNPTIDVKLVDFSIEFSELARFVGSPTISVTPLGFPSGSTIGDHIKVSVREMVTPGDRIRLGVELLKLRSSANPTGSELGDVTAATWPTTPGAGVSFEFVISGIVSAESNTPFSALETVGTTKFYITNIPVRITYVIP